ncbi:MAG TPA: hypothetical protein VFC19_04285 [Candidatus Limnocylindrales bacterium]|nr:hypothetical protein [Candidatus Limnocylindrales bacterium]
MSEQLRPFAPTTGDWRHNPWFEADVFEPYFQGSVYVDLRSGMFYLNLVTK